MSYQRTISGGFLRLVWVRDELTILELDADYLIRDVFIKRIVLTASNCMPSGITGIDVTYNDNDGKGLFFPSWESAIGFLNNPFSVENGFTSLWYIENGAVVFENKENFASGMIEVDQGVFASEFGEEFH